MNAEEDVRQLFLRMPYLLIDEIIARHDRGCWDLLVAVFDHNTAWDMLDSHHEPGALALAAIGEAVSREKAGDVLLVVRDFLGTGEPYLFDWQHEELSRGAWSIGYEGDYDWPMRFMERQNELRTIPAGVHMECIAGWCLGLYPER